MMKRGSFCPITKILFDIEILKFLLQLCLFRSKYSS